MQRSAALRQQLCCTSATTCSFVQYHNKAHCNMSSVVALVCMLVACIGFASGAMVAEFYGSSDCSGRVMLDATNITASGQCSSYVIQMWQRMHFTTSCDAQSNEYTMRVCSKTCDEECVVVKGKDRQCRELTTVRPLRSVKVFCAGRNPNSTC